MTTLSDYEFWDFVHLPENEGRYFERIAGNIVEVSPSKKHSAPFAEAIIATLRRYLMQQAIGYATSGHHIYTITSMDTYMPDVAYISGKRRYRPDEDTLNPISPDFVVEITCDCDLYKWTWINQKLERYAAANIPVVCICPERQQVEIHKRREPVQIIGLDGYIDGGQILPGFQISVAEILAPAS